MPASPLLVLHIAGGTAGILSGFLAISLRKGSRWHGIAGNVFFVSMLCMSSVGAYMAFRKSELSNVTGGVITFYMLGIRQPEKVKKIAAMAANLNPEV